MSATLSPCRRRLLRYLYDKILNRLIQAFMCSIKMRCLDNSWLNFFSSNVSLWFLLFLIGVRLLRWNFKIPWNPLSAKNWILSFAPWKDFLNSSKSCVLPLCCAMARIRFVLPSAKISVFIVCCFFFPEYHFFCPFLGVQSAAPWRQSKLFQFRPFVESAYSEGWKVQISSVYSQPK